MATGRRSVPKLDSSRRGRPWTRSWRSGIGDIVIADNSPGHMAAGAGRVPRPCKGRQLQAAAGPQQGHRRTLAAAPARVPRGASRGTADNEDFRTLPRRRKTELALRDGDDVAAIIIGAIPTGQPESHMLAISSDGRRGYTANVGPGTVSVLDMEAKKLIAIIPFAGPPSASPFPQMIAGPLRPIRANRGSPSSTRPRMR